MDDLTRGLSDAQFTWRSAPDRWSISECLGHLLLTEQIALRVIDRLLDETRRAKNAAKVPFSTAQWFRFTLAHQRRHLWQARGVRNHPGFPVE